MRYSDEDLRAAVDAGVLGAPELDRLLAFLTARRPAPGVAPAPVFDVAHLLWYAGALIVIGAMGLFTTVAFSQMGGSALVACAVVYAVAFTLAGHHLWYRRNLETPGGLLIAVAVSMAPLAVYGVQDALGWWGGFAKGGTMRDFYIWIKGSWVFMEIAAVAAGVVALKFYRFPFIVAIIAVALWFMSMDLTPWVFRTVEFSWEMKCRVSEAVGLVILAVAWTADYRKRVGDFAFWLHLFGMMAFWGALTSTESNSEVAKVAYCLLNVALLLIAVFLARRVYAVFGALGVTLYLGHLADVVFRDSLLFPFALSLIGVAVIAVGLMYHRRQAAIAAWAAANLPGVVLRLRPAHAR